MQQRGCKIQRCPSISGFTNCFQLGMKRLNKWLNGFHGKLIKSKICEQLFEPLYIP